MDRTVRVQPFIQSRRLRFWALAVAASVVVLSLCPQVLVLFTA